MADTTVSSAVVFPQDDGTGVADGTEDYNSAGYLGLLARAAENAYVASGLTFTNIDTTNETVDVTAGHAYVEESGVSVQSASQTTYDTALASNIVTVVALPSSVTLSLDTDAVNDIYLAHDPTSNDSVYLRHGSAVSEPTDPSIYLGTVDTSNGATTRANDTIGFSSSIDTSGTLSENGNRVATRTWSTSSNIAHADLSGITSDDHHVRYSNEEAQDAVGTILGSNFTYDDATPSVTLSSDTVTVAGKSVSLGGTTAINHADLSNIGSADHHTRYADSEAVSAVNAETSLSVDISGDADTVDGQHAGDFLRSNADDTYTGTLSVGDDTRFKGFAFGFGHPVSNWGMTPAQDVLAFSDKFGTVTRTSGSAPISGDISSAFDLRGSSDVRWDDTSTLPVTYEIDPNTGRDYAKTVVLTFNWGRYPTTITIEGYNDGTSTWETWESRTANDTQEVVAQVGNQRFTKIRITLDGIQHSSGQIALSKLAVMTEGRTTFDRAYLSRIGGDIHGSLNITGTLSSSGNQVLDNSNLPWANSDLANSSVTVAGNSVSLGGTTTINHADLSNIGSADHHTRYSDEEAQDAVGTILGTNFTYDDATPTITLSSDTVTVAGNSVALGGTTAINHADLSNIGSADHHTRYADEEAQDAVGTILSADFTYDDANNVINMSPHTSDSSAHHTRYADSEAVSAVESQATLNLQNLDLDGGDQGIYIHDGTGNFNIKSGVAQGSDNIVTTAGGSEIEMAESGSIILKVDESTTTGNAFTTELGITMDGGSISFTGPTSGISHDNLSNVSSADHHAKYTNEEAQDAVGTILGGQFTYDDATPAITLDQGSGSGLDADTVDGRDTGAMEPDTHYVRRTANERGQSDEAAFEHIYNNVASPGDKVVFEGGNTFTLTNYHEITTPLEISAYGATVELEGITDDPQIHFIPDAGGRVSCITHKVDHTSQTREGDITIDVSDTTPFSRGDFLLMNDKGTLAMGAVTDNEHHCQFARVETVIDSTTLELSVACHRDFDHTNSNGNNEGNEVGRIKMMEKPKIMGGTWTRGAGAGDGWAFMFSFCHKPEYRDISVQGHLKYDFMFTECWRGRAVNCDDTQPQTFGSGEAERFYIRRSGDTTIEKCHVEKCRRGIDMLSGTYNTHIINCKIYNFSHNGISVHQDNPVGKIHVEGGEIRGAEDDGQEQGEFNWVGNGISGSQRLDELIVEGVTIQCPNYGVYCEQPAIISDCVFVPGPQSRSGASGVRVENSDVQIENCLFDSTRSAGVWHGYAVHVEGVENITDVKINGNFQLDGEGQGIHIGNAEQDSTGTIDRVSIDANIEDNGTSAIAIRTQAANARIDYIKITGHINVQDHAIAFDGAYGFGHCRVHDADIYCPRHPINTWSSTFASTETAEALHLSNSYFRGNEGTEPVLDVDEPLNHLFISNCYIDKGSNAVGEITQRDQSTTDHFINNYPATLNDTN